MAKSLLCRRRLTGLITATALAVDRSVTRRCALGDEEDEGQGSPAGEPGDVIQGVQEMGVELESHIQFVIEAMRREATAIGLGGRTEPGT
jgi:predicted hydrolase (HD superfamily)